MDLRELAARERIKSDRLEAAVADLAAVGEHGPDRLVDILRSYLPTGDFEMVRRAWRFAAAAHHGQRRKGGGPYFVHPIAVAELVLRLRLDEASVCAGLLHDVVEDCDVTLAEIRERFSDDIAHIVDGVTKLDKIPFARSEEKQAENFRKMLVAMSKDIRVLLIKLCDRLHNMSTLEAMSAPKQKRIAAETMEIYAPLANRLGIGWMKTELEDLCFRYLEPDDYTALKHAVGERKVEREAYIASVVDLLRSELAAADLSDAAVSGRPKHLHGIWRKMQRAGVPYERIHDAQAFRVLTDNTEQCYRALGVVHSRFTPIPGRFKDYIALPKANNYQSLHTTVLGPDNKPIEVQIRTHDMHRIAENGVAAHWRYKERGAAVRPRDEARFTWLKQLLELSKEAPDSDEFLENMRVDLFADEVYTFTPAGDVKVFPRGATPVDFAYAVHTRVGETAVGAKVNGHIVSLDSALRNGDIVDIMTRSDSRPNKGWLSFVRTSRAKTKIRNFVRAAERAQAQELGADRLEKALRRHKISLTRAERHDKLAATLSQFRCQTWEELLIGIGYGKIDARGVVEHLYPETKPAEKPKEADTVAPKRSRKRSEDDAAIVIDGIEDILVRFARCCSPVPGDDVVGFVTRGRGITVHQRHCPRALDSDPMRRLDIAWNRDRGGQARVTVRVHTGNGPGMLEKMSSRFREAGVNIRSVQAKMHGPLSAVSTFEVEVASREQLDRVILDLKRLDFVHKVDRIGG
ncbi:MAG: bifunctional (p)ppGpp synthetase/guanosine-3',5'-bis(diphosphate) 3'-pyrophosphohydrolase [Deltaproteobacteria bacterium]|nr:bifunctional (p)ppGpp synthetase/guanosine-3',5'-bis(diphosphate) 3'-pyrophosphohydrolase [Deltaproteobacteria bacterium]